uniref:NADH dehydrogenase subunit 5 n=1 Tax=Stigmaeopsis nanjingensis TaxID=486490 RepID=UPI00286D48A3|nr:NADH dehydrogenase subunit 5 [Stigmaeopsis nanjingensis]WKW93594.1 NADH dehydrogenase subunit 5 [Stigmaeopsis nanjingensis]
MFLVKFMFFSFMLLDLFYLFVFMINKFYLIFSFNEYFFFLNISLSFLIDYFSLMFTFTIFLVLYNVMNFMYMYMYMNKNFIMFFIMSLLFMFSMLFLVFSFDLWVMLIGWELLGLSSFYLIFYYNNNDSWNSAIKTFVNNKIGDSIILISIIYLSLSSKYFLVSFLFMFAMLTKSAQYPFMAWLPMAMSAPTPISAMVHSSTLVTAGLYMFFRFSFCFINLFSLTLLMDLCLISMLVSSLKGLIEKDMKKLIALSTLSQIGLMLYLHFLNFKIISFFYMCNHAFFKSLMFMNMGYMMMINYSNQFNFNMNVYNLGIFYNLSLKLSCLNLMNMAFFSSFFLKEMLINCIFINLVNMLKFFIFIFSSFFTMNYSLKMIFFSFSLNFKLKSSLLMMSNLSFLFSLFFMNLVSLIYSKFVYCFFLFYSSFNFFLIFLYFFMLLINFYIFMMNFNFVTFMLFLNFMLYTNFMSVLHFNILFIDLWMEKMTLHYYFYILNKNIFKSFLSSLKMVLTFLILFLFI